MTGESISAETAGGRVAGASREGLLVFKNIPFAGPATGRHRWAPPQPPAPWTGARDARLPGPFCPQNPSQLEAIMGGTRTEQSEDCLSLNVWTPALTGARPVMVWIHGGAFVHGSGGIGLYSGRNLALQGDVVVVTLNYRLGALGFLNLRDATHGRIAATGTEGLQDQIAALRWVQANIARFGGNPGNVTIFGESAGGMSVACLLAMPQAAGLFHKAIPQSGAAHIGRTRAETERTARALLDVLGLKPEEAERLYELPAADILKAQATLIEEVNGRDPRGLGAMPFQPTIDGTHLPERPIAALAAGRGAPVPLLTGTTNEEWKLFSALDPAVNQMTAEHFDKWAAKRLPEASRERVLAVYEGESPFVRFNAIQTDRVFRVPATRLAEALGPRAPVFMYRFDWTSPLMNGVFGAAHALEIGFVFGTHVLPGADRFFGTGPEAEALARAMIACWTAFAHRGDPATAETGPWPVYEPAHRAVMVFGRGRPELHEAPGERERRAWADAPDERLGS